MLALSTPAKPLVFNDARSFGSFGEAVIGGYRERHSRERVVTSVGRFRIKRMQHRLIFVESVGDKSGNNNLILTRALMRNAAGSLPMLRLDQPLVS